MSTEKNSYRQIVKATSIFGGVQVFNIFISIVRNKVIAVLLGTSGMGIFAIFYSISSLINGFSNFGLSTAAVKNVSHEYATGDEEEFIKTRSVLQILLLFTGIIGFFCTLVLSQWLSKINFNSFEFTGSFVLLSFSVLTYQLQQGFLITLQATQKIKLLARASLVGAFLGLLINLPMFYLWREKAIVPSILVASFISLSTLYFFYRKAGLPLRFVFDKKVFRERSKSMLKMGILINLVSLISYITTYSIRLFILKKGSISDLGLYSAGFSLITTYFGLVFTAMGTDYYPRLSKVSNDNASSFKEMNQQAEIAMLIIAPLLCLFLIFIKNVIALLYSVEFLATIPMLKWAVIGVFFQAFSWAIAFLFLAKGDNKTFFWNELFNLCYVIFFSITGYIIGGLTGLGLGFCIQYIFYFIHMYVVVRRKYGFKISKQAFAIFWKNLVLISACFLCTEVFKTEFLKYLTGCIIILLSLLFTYSELNKKLLIADMVKSRLGRGK